MNMFHLEVRHPYASKKVAHEWPNAGMDPTNYESWLRTFKHALEEQSQSSWLKESLEKGIPLKIEIVVFGIKQRIKLLDVDSIADQIFNILVDYFFPREKWKPIPCVHDRHFWALSVRKFVNTDERLDVTINPIECLAEDMTPVYSTQESLD